MYVCRRLALTLPLDFLMKYFLIPIVAGLINAIVYLGSIAASRGSREAFGRRMVLWAYSILVPLLVVANFVAVFVVLQGLIEGLEAVISSRMRANLVYGVLAIWAICSVLGCTLVYRKTAN
jgi:hypothetical protein